MSKTPLIFLSFGLAILSSIPCYSEQLVEGYRAYLSERDHFNSKGQRLTTVPDIIRQDRANFHRFGLRDLGDEDDRYFADQQNREAMEKLFGSRQIDSETISRIVTGTPLVRVEVYKGDAGYSASVQIVSRAPQPGGESEQAPTQPAPPMRFTSWGTGFTVSNDGLVLTNYHVVGKCDADAVIVHDLGLALVKEIDPQNDLALLKIESNTSPATFRTTTPNLGEPVHAVGFPLPQVLGAGLNFTSGAVSSLSGLGNDTRFLQMTAPIQPGNSGGPLVDGNGLVVGVSTETLRAAEMLKETGAMPQSGVNFAIRGDLVKHFLMANGVEPVVADPINPLSSSEIAKNARAYTVQIICQGTVSEDSH